MKVHIALWQNTHIVPRMSQWLVERNGWTISGEPDPSADINYFMPYLQWSIETHPRTLTAAWFTHYEQGTTWKVDKWQDAKAFIDMPLVTAPMYCANLKRAKVVTPCVDRERFHPGDKPARKKPLIGTAGVGHPRKGPHLIVDLFYSSMNLDMRIAGRAWPFPFVTVSNEYMPTWYQHLDVYLCTSLIEGIPAPVLEALASDTKVVIPDDVGICDQLPEMEGIRHYRKGDSDDMMRALQQAIDDRPSKGSLRDVTDGYTIDDWCFSHRQAMEELIDARISV